MFKRTVGALFIVGALFLTIVTPAAASTGKVGRYSLTDTSSRPGATAKYKYVIDDRDPGENHWALHRIVVRPPNMKAVSGKSQQTVGWSFTVQRMACFEPPCGDWQDRYTSPIFTAVTSSSANASFSKEGVGVRVPQNPGLYHYRTIVNMYWYKADNSVQGTASAQIDWYKQVTGNSSHVDEGCPAAIYGQP